MSEDYLKYDGRMPEPPYETGPAPKEEEMGDEMVKARRADYNALTAERDRLAAENAELKQRLTRSIIAADLAAANATLDRLREVVPEGDDNPEEWPYGNGPGCVRRVQAILYPPETTP